MADQQSLNQTKSYSNSENKALNEARFISLEELQSTPSTRKHSLRPITKTRTMMKQIQSCSPEEEWMHLLTQSIRQTSSTPTKGSQSNSKEHIVKTAQVKDRQSGKLQKICAICLCDYDNERGSLSCQHQFCFSCIEQWTESSTVCPCCRKEFTSILKMVRETSDGLVKETSRVQVEMKKLAFQSEYDHYVCYQCGSGDNEHVLLICDDCDFYCCHVYCDQELDGRLPRGNWYCIYCQERRRRTERRRRRRSRVMRGTRRGGRATNFFFGLREIELQESNFELVHSEISQQEIDEEAGMSSRTRSHQTQAIPGGQNSLTLLRSIRRRDGR